MRKYYTKIKQEFLDFKGYKVPEKYQSSFVCWGGGTEAQYIYKQFLKDIPLDGKILIIGVMGGRDYFFFKNHGYDVVAVDLGEQPDIDSIVIANVEDKLPFPDKYFDGIIIGEVLEHLKEDVKALNNLSSVLKDSGKLAVSIPFYNDWEEGHMRIHSPESGRRLLGMAGFGVEDYLERPAIIWLPILNFLLHIISLFSWWLTGKTAYPWLTDLIGKFEWKVGHLIWLRKIRSLSKPFGGYYLCHKQNVIDHLTVNKELYTLSS
jgi:SAM-dependent methyltransferase